MFKITLTISILIFILAITCFACASANFRKALEYSEQGQEENSIKRGLLYVLFSRYSDLFFKSSIIGFILSFIVRMF